MRIVKEIPHPAVKITIFHWNNRYLIKLEANFLEQTYKLQEFDVTSEEDVIKMVDDRFLEQAMTLFQGMDRNFANAFSNLDA